MDQADESKPADVEKVTRPETSQERLDRVEREIRESQERQWGDRTGIPTGD